MKRFLFKYRRWFLGLLGIGLTGVAVVAVMLLLNSVDTAVTDQDREVIGVLEIDDECAETDGIDEELRCIEAVQESVFELIPDTTCGFERGESEHTASGVAERGYGCCYDRATLIEQVLRHHGFEVRRTALYKRQSNPLKYFQPGIPSHALSEVKTAEGWLAVESLAPFVGVDDRGEVYDMPAIREGMEAGVIDDETFGVEIPSNFFEGDFAYIYGMYSRHGFFFEPHIPVPEVEWATFGW